MTGVEPTKGKIHVGISVDQLAAQTLGKETQFASLELATENNNGRQSPTSDLSSRARRSLFRSSTIRACVFERLFGEGGRIDPAASAARAGRGPEQLWMRSPSASRN